MSARRYRRTALIVRISRSRIRARPEQLTHRLDMAVPRAGAVAGTGVGVFAGNQAWAF